MNKLLNTRIFVFSELALAAVFLTVRQLAGSSVVREMFGTCAQKCPPGVTCAAVVANCSDIYARLLIIILPFFIIAYLLAFAVWHGVKFFKNK